MAFHRKPREWRRLAETALLEGLGGEDPAQELWKAVSDLQVALELASVWKNSACSWEARSRELEARLAERVRTPEDDPDKVEAVARATYREFRRRKGLRDDWEQEPLQRRRDLEHTIRVILQALSEYPGD